MKITGSCIITGTFTSAERGLRVAEEQSSLYGVKRNAWPSRIKSWESDSGGEWQSSIIKAVDNRASSLLNTCARWRSIAERGMEKVEDLSRRSLIRHRDIVIWEENGWDKKRKKKNVSPTMSWRWPNVNPSGSNWEWVVSERRVEQRRCTRFYRCL